MIDQRSIHGHEIIHLIHGSPAPLTRRELATAVHDRYGPDARFHTCSAKGMTLPQLLDFLMARGKIVEREGRLQVQIQNVCDHDH